MAMPISAMSFLSRSSYYRYFDPAFAGRHSVLLDIVKPFFHNVFATWMYFPNEVARDLQLSVELRDGCVFVEHNYVSDSGAAGDT